MHVQGIHLGQAWANYGLGAICFLVWPSELEEIIFIVRNKKAVFHQLFSV